MKLQSRVTSTSLRYFSFPGKLKHNWKDFTGGEEGEGAGSNCIADPTCGTWRPLSKHRGGGGVPFTAMV